MAELSLRLSSWPAYMFCHLGCCEHLVQVALCGGGREGGGWGGGDRRRKGGR